MKRIAAPSPPYRTTPPNDATDSNFEAGTALENLRAEMIDIEALARASESAAEALAFPTSDRQRLLFGRIQSFTTKASQQAGASLRFADAQVAVHATHLEARRKAAARWAQRSARTQAA